MTCLTKHFSNKLNEVCLLNSSFSFSSLSIWAISQKKNAPVKAEKGRRAIPWWLKYFLKQGSTLACAFQTSQACTRCGSHSSFWSSVMSPVLLPHSTGEGSGHTSRVTEWVGLEGTLRDHLIPILFHGHGCHSLDKLLVGISNPTRSRRYKECLTNRNTLLEYFGFHSLLLLPWIANLAVCFPAC